MKKIDRIKDIASQHPQGQIWKYLRTFLDEPTTIRRLKRYHQTPEKEKGNNIKKQAEQISYCILQAEEYFKSAQYASLVTKPLLLYYGSISLSHALILFTNNGKVSFDYLRKKGKQWGHGLDLKVDSFPRNIKEIPIVDILKNIRAKIRKDAKGNPQGHFKTFYNSLLPAVVIIPLSQKTNKVSLDKKKALESMDIKPLNNIDEKTLNVLNLTSNLPDLYDYFLDINMLPNLCKARPSIQSILHYENNKITKATDRWKILIDGINEEGKKSLLKHLRRKKCPFTPSLNIPNHLILSFSGKYKPEESFVFHCPDMLDDIGANIFILVNPEKSLEEKAMLYILQYCLGTLCRYNPDIWMRLIRGNVVFREFIDSLLRVIERKFPNLILDQLIGEKHYIHI